MGPFSGTILAILAYIYIYIFIVGRQSCYNATDIIHIRGPVGRLKLAIGIPRKSSSSVSFKCRPTEPRTCKRQTQEKKHSLPRGAGLLFRDWSLITGRGGLQNGKIAGPKLFAPPPPSRQGKTFRAPPFKEWKLFVTPLQYG